MTHILPKQKRGGKRPGAGRPKGSGKFREETKSIRIPLPLMATIEELLSLFSFSKKEGTLFLVDKEGSWPPRPFFSSRIQAGFPSSTDDHIEGLLNLQDYAIAHPESTFFVKVRGDSMKGASIHDGDILVVDRSIPPKDGSIVIASLDGEMTVKRLFLSKEGEISLQPENPNYPPFRVQEGQDFTVFGVVTFVLHRC